MEDLTQAVPPCRIYLTDGTVFLVPNVNAWQNNETDLYATGCWSTGEPDAILLNHTSVKYISLDYAALRAWQSEQMQEALSEADPGDAMQEAA